MKGKKILYNKDGSEKRYIIKNFMKNGKQVYELSNKHGYLGGASSDSRYWQNAAQHSKGQGASGVPGANKYYGYTDLIMRPE